MSANASPPIGAATIASAVVSTPTQRLAPDTRELLSVAAVAATVLVAHVTALGPMLLAPWLPSSGSDATSVQALALVAARFGAWLLGALMLSIVFSMRWMPRAHQRLLEPSLIASWATVAASITIALGLNRLGAWPWSWASTSPETAITLSALASNGHVLAIGLWVVCACLVIPLLSELVFRHALLEVLRVRGLSSALSVAIASVAFAATYLVTWPLVAGAALQHAGVALVLGALLGTIAVRGKRGRGLGLAIIAHGAFVATELAVLLRSLLAG